MKLKNQEGLGLLEVAIALLIFFIALLTLAQAIIGTVVLNTKNRELMKVSTMCKDKTEQLLILAFNDATTNTTVEPSGDPLVYPTGGAAGKGLSIGGSVAPAAPVTGYIDFLDSTGSRVTSTNPNARFRRQWRISQTGNIKKIEVTVRGASAAFQTARTVTYKTN